MRSNAKLRVVESSGVGASAEFGISLNDSAHIMTILRDTLYSDKVLAVLREYGSNAWDAHRMAGKPDERIKVTMPTDMDPTLSIRDYGPGLSQDEVFKIYTQYGASTKRDSDVSVGTLGIGSKSAFAYSDSFSVTSFNGGMKRNYVAVLDPSDKGVINLLHEEPTEETGVLIQVAIKPSDIPEFVTKAQGLFKYFKPLPILNIQLPELPPSQSTFKNGVIFDENEVGVGWVAVMGCVPYKVDLTQLRGFGADGVGLADFFHNLSGVVYFDIGEVQINASREGLKYNDVTKNKLVDRFNDLVEEYVGHIIKTIDDSNLSPWAKRFEAVKLAAVKTKLTGREWLVDEEIFVKEMEHKEFTLSRHEDEVVANIALSKESRLIYRDNRRQLKKYHLSDKDIVITPAFKVTWPEVEKAVEAFCAEARITGIPIVKLSSLPVSLTASVKYKSNINHRRSTFKLKPLFNHYHVFDGKNSGRWEAEERVPTTDDVFVILEYFEVSGRAFYHDHEHLLKVAEHLKVQVPQIYGYKTTEKHPVDESEVAGVEYYTWRKEFLRSLLTPKTVDALNYNAWGHLFEHMYFDRKMGVVCKQLRQELGDNHPITKLFRLARIGHIWVKRKKPGEILTQLETDLAEAGIWSPDADFLQKMVLDKYTLVSITNQDLRVFGTSKGNNEWLRYVKAIDALEGTGVNP